MGCFNEVCALSGLPITYQDKVKYLFLTQSGKARGCRHFSGWTLRTPPLSGTYDDGGGCIFTEKTNVLTALIWDVFQDDLVECSYGKNSYHDLPVLKSFSVQQLAMAAWKNRLFVKDSYQRARLPERFPTWDKVQNLLTAAGIKVMTNVTAIDDAYNAMAIQDGIVYVTRNSYRNKKSHFDCVLSALSETYDCQYISKHSEIGVYVLPKGALENKALLLQEEKINSLLQYTPMDWTPDPIPNKVVGVMVLEEVWDAYKNCSAPSVLREQIFKCMKGETEKYKMRESLRYVFEQEAFAVSHIEHLLEFFFGQQEQLTDLSHLGDADYVLDTYGEVAAVESTLERLCQAWNPPCIGSQDRNWDIHKKLNQAVGEIIDNRIKSEEEE